MPSFAKRPLTMRIDQVDPQHYEQQLTDKIARITEQFSNLDMPTIEAFDSPKSHYRMRAEFKIWHEGDRCDYAMYQPGEYKKPFIIEQFPVGSELINRLMKELIDIVNPSQLLKRKLFQIEFLTTTTGQAVVTLIYHKPLGEDWLQLAEQISKNLGIHIIGRSRKSKTVIGQDFVIETLKVKEREYHYQQVETGFTQPNAKVCEKMLTWAVDCAEPLSGDLVELYCGNGNFTLPLASQFDRVMATEISKTSVKSAHFNMAHNGVDNITVLRMSSEEFSQALDKEREFRRLENIDLDTYDFTTIFVDPPRAGLDPHTVDIVKGFDNILYISCNPDTLHENLQSIQETHTIERFAVFDQFPYTHHLECGVLLKAR